MPTKKGSSKASKAKKASNKQRKAPKRGVTGRAGATRRVSTGRVTATGRSRGTSKKAAEPAARPNPGTAATGGIGGTTFSPNPSAGSGIARGPEGMPDRKATDTNRGASEGNERIRDL